MIDHTTRAFDAELRQLARKIQEMGRLDKQQITDAIDSLLKRDHDLARQVVATDDQVDALQRDLANEAIVSIARRQPMAVELREIVGALRISIDLERIGDLAENIAKRALQLTEVHPLNDVMLQLQRMAQLVVDQLTRVLESYERRDVGQALEVWHRDEEIDALENSLFRELLTYMMENPHNISLCTHLLFCSKSMERMGDHVTNIAEDTYYIVAARPLLKESTKKNIAGKQASSLHS